MSVIDAALRFSQCSGMLDHDEILAELVRRLDAKTVKANAVAEHLKIAAPRVTEMRNGARRIQPHEMAKLARFLGIADREDRDAAEVIKIWDHIPRDRRSHALEILETFADREAEG